MTVWRRGSVEVTARGHMVLRTYSGITFTVDRKDCAEFCELIALLGPDIEKLAAAAAKRDAEF